MAYNNDQEEFALPSGNNNKRKSAQHLPRYFRTQINKKFLASTLDQLLQPGVAEKVSGYIGRRVAAARTTTDNYLDDVSQSRENYQLEPASIIRDNLGNVSFYKDYNDYINQIKAFGGNVDNHDLLNKQEMYSWNPHIDWDKFVNFREYYWLPNGPQTVDVFGQTNQVESTIVVTTVDNIDNRGYVFSSEGPTQNPTVILYRGQKYRFEIDAQGLPFSIKTKRTLDEAFFYNNASDKSVEVGFIDIEINEESPEELFYVADNDINSGGQILIKDISENSDIDVEKEIIGRRYYTTGGGFSLSNGMKIRFVGNVVPEKYASGEWYVEGVGSKIVLINEKDLEIPATYSQDILIPFDSENFDRLPFGNASSFAGTKDYLVISRASKDGNPWTRYNRWFHKDVIEESARINGQPVTVDQIQRARRPIIEFEANLKLFKFGTSVKQNVDLIDTFTKDVFSEINGKLGYNIDGVDISEGMRILFAADTDILVKNKIYQVKFITHNNVRQIALIETDDTEPLENETVLVTKGDAYRGKMFYYQDDTWNLAQDKIKNNQAPLFDIFDENEFSYADTTIYESSTFNGCKIFSYKEGTGNADVELGFPLTYRSIENVGDIVYNFDLLSDEITYQIRTALFRLKTDIGFLRRYTDRTAFESLNAWTKTIEESSQDVVRQFLVEDGSISNDFPIDVYDSSALLDDLKVKVFLNNKLLFKNIDYVIENINNVSHVRFNNQLSQGSVLTIKTRSKQTKNQNGYYEIPYNLERNPQNDNVTTFTLGEVNDHVLSIVSELDTFAGTYPGPSNLRDLGNLSPYGRKFVQHSGPVNLALYHLTNKDANIIKSMRFARKEYAKFKRKFLQTAYNLGYDGPVKEHVDEILKEINRDKTNTMPFYFSDMSPYGKTRNYSYTVVDSGNEFFALTQIFDLDKLTPRSVLVYKNEEQLVYERDYTFNSDGFCVITAAKQLGDVITIYEYETTDGCFIPPTPTKLGLYPKFIPEIFIDNTYKEPKKVIQGHDGSITLAYDDFRDDLILELEKRIFNNIKQTYNPLILDIHAFVGGTYRNTGFTKQTIDNAMTPDFVEWNQRVGSIDYTLADFYDSTNQFTFNYKYMTGPTGQPLPGYWRAVYKQAYDTDRPHTHPWEMLGFTIKPDWWETQYGPAPYTKDNLILWKDLSEGNIRKPGEPLRVNPKYKRPTLLNHIPVDESGNLLSPLASNYAQGYVASFTRRSYTFGDETPTETAWRRSSEYPFSLITSWILNQPTKVFGLGFDISRIKKNFANQIVYGDTNKSLHLKKLVFPNTSKESVRVMTSGLVNYVFNYLISDVTTSYDKYKSEITTISNHLGSKIAGFTDKSKFQLILDSRTPLNQGNVFVPSENYSIILNTSSPVEVASYSGIIIEKQSSGYIVRGYDFTNPTFSFYQTIELDTDPLINVGGISESFLTWESGSRYSAGTIVQYNNQYYRTKEDHTSNSFDNTKFTKLPKLPVEGGQNSFFRSTFSDEVTVIPYGTLFRTVQEVVDFILGYASYLESKGFVFDYYNNDIGAVENWKLSAKEFMFWTTQNWSAGALLALSPAATQLKFSRDHTVVDNIFDNFYDYSLLKADGQKLKEEFVVISRADTNEFVIQTKNTADGIYHLRLPLVQKEHVVIIDNKTIFGDVIYDLEPGYRQERIKVQGYRSETWYGGLNVPGFLYDDVTVTEWEQWKDYPVGSVVKYKEFFYVAIELSPGTEEFNNSQWSRLAEKPESGLITNFEYKTNQFADFYDLDSDNFDIEQQKLSQHLIGYQKRQYLQNIINDDVSQFKFYQGYIADKGTRNAIDKLFDALSSANKDSIDFYEEWAIKKGQYGATEGFDEIEYKLDEAKFLLEPQPIELVQTLPIDSTDLIYRIRPFETYLRPTDYDHKPFPVEYTNKEFVKTTGYVTGDDVAAAVLVEEEILDLQIDDIDGGSYVWIAKYNQSWDVRKHVISDMKILSIKTDAGKAIFTVDKTCTLNVDQIIGIQNIPNQSSGFFKVMSVSLNTFTLDNDSSTFEDTETNISGTLSIFVSKRVANVEEANAISQKYLDEEELVWIDDDGTGKWTVLKNSGVFSKQQFLPSPENYSSEGVNFANVISSNENNTVVAVGAPDSGDGKVYIYTRPADSTNLLYSATLEARTSLFNNSILSKFGSSVALSPDGELLAVGSPKASNVKTRFKGDFSPYGPTNTSLNPSNYQKNDIVRYNEKLYSAVRTILPQDPDIDYTSFDAYAFYANTTDSTEINLLQLGNYKLEDSVTSHMLVRAPLDMWRGTAVGDFVTLHWNTETAANLVDDLIEPFPGNNVITSSFIIGEHEIVDKIDHVFYVPQYLYLPLVGDTVSTEFATGKVVYVTTKDGAAVIYVNEVKGVFAQSEELFVNEINSIGLYSEDFYSVNENFGGYWMINTPSYTNNNIFVDPGKGLVYRSIRLSSETPQEADEYYQNIRDLLEENISSLNQQQSFISQLSYQGDPNGIFDSYFDNRIVVRAPRDLITSGIDVGSTVGIWLDDITFDVDNPSNNFGLTPAQINKKHVIADLWDGYIDFTFTEFDNSGNPFEPAVGTTVRDIQTGATAVVAFYRRQFNTIRIYVKNVTGGWSLGRNWGENSDIEKLAAVGSGDADRTMGRIDAVSLGTSTVGPLLVFENAQPYTVFGKDIINEEYWIFTERDLGGISRPANIPSSSNLDWREVYNIPATELGNASDLENEGMISIFRKLPSGEFSFVNSYVVPERSADNHFGEQLKFVKSGDLYTLFASAGGNNQTDVSISTNYGAIYFIKHGSDANGTYEWELSRDRNYRGTFELGYNYVEGEVAKFDENLYTALTNISNANEEPNVSSDWELIENPTISHIGYVPSSSPLATENFFTSPDLLKFSRKFDVNRKGDVLVVSTITDDVEVLISLRGINDRIKLINQSKTDLGYYSITSTDSNVSTTLTIKFVDSSTYAVNVIELSGSVARVRFNNATERFNFLNTLEDSIDNIESIVFTRSDVVGTVATATGIKNIQKYSNNPVLVYRQNNGHFELDQTIYAPSIPAGFGESIAISNDGKLLAIGEPYSSQIEDLQGKVHVYSLQDGKFVLTQTLYSPNNEEGEEFGYNLDFDGNQLAITSLKGDIDIASTFDSGTTIFDNNFTKFRRSYLDSGVIFVYERINDSLLFAQELDFSEISSSGDYIDTTFFGKTLLISENHIYVGMPRLTDNLNYTGVLVDYRKPSNTKSWTQHRRPLDQVNVSKIRNAFLYNTKTNEIVTTLDIIDPIQGKIAGPAEQELSFKTYYDPATYSNAFSSAGVVVDATNSWDETQVGRVWWDLSTVRFYNPYQNDTIYQTNFWNKIFPTTSVDVYEWVESTLRPSEWDDIADTEDGLTSGISGISKYGDNAYVEKRKYNPRTGIFSSVYYFWVKNKTTVPNKEFRSTSVASVATLIASPSTQGYRYVALLSENKFVLHNCADLLKNKDVAINISYWTIDNKEQNVHNEYQIITVDDGTSLPKKDIELKWFDSLIGYDSFARPVPDPNLSPKQKYGSLFKPRQSWFINKTEALKQVVERINSVLIKNIIVDEYDISPLFSSDPIPTELSRLFDTSVDTDPELQFVGTAKLEQAKLTPIVEDGSIVRVVIDNPGRGYRQIPSYEILGSGSGAELDIVLDIQGKISSVSVVKGGTNYGTNTSIVVRKFAVLVRSDSNVTGKWAIYERDGRIWSRIYTQDYDVSLFWDYADWYAEGYNEFTPVTYYLDESYQLTSIDSIVGDIIKIANVGTGGWLLLEKIANTGNEDYTLDYKTIGRENGTIQLKNTLYDLDASLAGYSSASYDTQFYDSQPAKETRIILETIRDKIFVDELAIEYNRLFFASLRYVFAEQKFVDWAFKTSFIRAKHNIGTLNQPVNFRNDNLASYEDYITEVKPYKTKIREYVSAYDGFDNSQTSTTDFDLPPRFNKDRQRIETQSIVVKNNQLENVDITVSNEYPRKHWYDNVGYKITDIVISNAGSGYTNAPKVNIIGGGGTGATARAYYSSGKVVKVEVINQGRGYLSAPRIEFEGAIEDNGTPATAVAILGNGMVRSTNIKFKFDRVSGNFYIVNLQEKEIFNGTGNVTTFKLKWPVDIRIDRIVVTVDGIEALSQDYNVTNIDDNSKTYARKIGQIEFVDPPAKGSNIEIHYYRNIELLTAQDRINFYYNPASGMIGKDVAQLMDGIDYGGVEVRSFDFGSGTGWDSEPWYSSTWDTYDTTFEDEIVQLDGSTETIELSKPLEQGVVYNIYKKSQGDLNAIRLDDPNYGTPQQTNPNAVCESIIGSGQTVINLGELGIFGNVENDVIIIRKTTSDGSFLPDPTTYDTQLSGGNLTYTTATGINSEDIIVDGDGFVTPTTSKGPEELIPGQILDTLDIKVYEREGAGSSVLYSTSQVTDGILKTFSFYGTPANVESIIVKVNRETLDSSEYAIDYANNEVILNTAPAAGSLLTIITMGLGTQRVLDVDSFDTDGSTQIFVTRLQYKEETSIFVTLNGNPVDVELFETDTTYGADAGRFAIKFATAPDANQVINYGIFADNSIVNFSQIKTEKIIADGNTTDFTIETAPFYKLPLSPNVIVKVDDKIQNPGYSQTFEVSSGREYQLRRWQQPGISLQVVDIRVYLNNVEILSTVDWRWDVYNSSVILFNGVGNIGDRLDVFVVTDGEYQLNGNELTFTNAPVAGSVIEVIQFSNHDIQKIERTNLDVISREVITSGTRDYTEYYNLTTGLIKLSKPAVEARYVWVILNGTQLIPDVDYNVTTNNLYVKINTPLEQQDVIEIIHFTGEPTTGKFGFRQFKDMLNRVHYKRLYTNNDFKLAQDLNYYDLRIEVVDASELPEPNKLLNIPGVIFIDGERIEYMLKDGNSLRQLRRGTLGTGVKEFYPAGTEFMDQSSSETVPYKDETVTTIFEANGTQTQFTLDFDSTALAISYEQSTGIRLSENSFFEVFVAGRRLRKNSISVFDPTLNLDSPEGDVVKGAEFTAEGTILTLAEAPQEGQKIMIIRRTGKAWAPIGTELRYAENDISRFLRAKTVSLPK